MYFLATVFCYYWYPAFVFKFLIYKTLKKIAVLGWSTHHSDCRRTADVADSRRHRLNPGGSGWGHTTASAVAGGTSIRNTGKLALLGF